MNQKVMIALPLVVAFGLSGCETAKEMKLAAGKQHEYSYIRNNESVLVKYIPAACDSEAPKSLTGTAAVAAAGWIISTAFTEAEKEIASAIEKYTAKYVGVATVDGSNTATPACLIVERRIGKEDNALDDKPALKFHANIVPSEDATAFKIQPLRLALRRAAAKTKGSGDIALKFEIKIQTTGTPAPNADSQAKPSPTAVAADETMETKVRLPSAESGQVDEKIYEWLSPDATREERDQVPNLLKMSESGWFPAFPKGSNLTIRVAVAESGVGTKGFEMLGKLLKDNQGTVESIIKDAVKKAVEAEK
jgi:hypothetical protein